jgi:single-stranded DNA-binding protein
MSLRSDNQIRIRGNLTSDLLESGTGTTGVKYARFYVAQDVSVYDESDNTYKKKRTNFFPVVVFGSLAERATGKLKKGTLLEIVGEAKLEPFEKDGVTRTAFEVIGRELTLIAKFSGSSKQTASETETFENAPF